MRATYFYGAGDIRVGSVPDAAIETSTDAVIRVVRACICGTDLHLFHQSPEQPVPAGLKSSELSLAVGHEFVGVVEDVGSEVTSVRRGDMVVAPLAHTDNTCPCCGNLHVSYAKGGIWGFGINGARSTVTVIGDGAVGLMAVLAANRLGAERIILMGRHEDRTDRGLEFGGTDVARGGESAVTIQDGRGLPRQAQLN